MNNRDNHYNEVTPTANIPTLVTPVFLIADTSGSMHGQKIKEVMLAINSINAQLSYLNRKYSDFNCKVSVMSFNIQPRWECLMQDPALVNVELTLGTVTCMGAAFDELEKAFCSMRKPENRMKYQYRPPVLILLCDGVPYDDFTSSLERLKNDRFFTLGLRIAFAIGDDADLEILKKFTGTSETVVQINDDNLGIISRLLTPITIGASMTSARSDKIDFISSEDLEPSKELALSAENSKAVIDSALKQVDHELNSIM